MCDSSGHLTPTSPDASHVTDFLDNALVGHLCGLESEIKNLLQKLGRYIYQKQR